MEKDQIIRSQQLQIKTLNDVIYKQDHIMMNSDAMIDILKAQITAEKKNNRKLFLGAGIGAEVAGVLVVIFR